MFSKGVVLIFLILGLSSSIAHAIPHQNRAQVTDPCNDPNPSKKASALGKGGDKANTTTTSTKNGDTTHRNTTNTLKGTSNNKANSTNNGSGADGDTSLTLDQSVINLNSKSDGLNNAANGTSPSLTSTNNFINFCKGKTITNGQQVKGGSCNPIPMGDIASANNMPSCKYVSPKNLDTLKSGTSFTMTLAVKNMQLGVFTNPESNYYAAPQQLNKQGNVIGHTHLLIEQLDSLTSTTPTTPGKFAFFKGIDGPAGADGTVSAAVASGLPAGTYRFGTITTTANHVPVLAAVAQHGSFEDAIYVTVTDDGNPKTGTGNSNTTNPDTGTGKKGTADPKTGTGKKGTANPNTGTGGKKGTADPNTGNGNTTDPNTGTGNTTNPDTGTGNKNSTSTADPNTKNGTEKAGTKTTDPNTKNGTEKAGTKTTDPNTKNGTDKAGTKTTDPKTKNAKGKPGTNGTATNNKVVESPAASTKKFKLDYGKD